MEMRNGSSRLSCGNQNHASRDSGWKTVRDSKEKYGRYLQSREWSVKREAVRKRAGGLCERCLCNAMYSCHHLTYLRKYDESLDDLQALCRGCHDFLHARTNTDPARSPQRMLQFPT